MLRRRSLLLVPAVALACAAPAAAQPPGLIPTVSKIRTNGIGAFKVGMTRKQAREVRHTYHGLRTRENLGGGHDLVWKSHKGRLIFSIANGRVTRIAGGRVPWVLQQECV
jgi:hypothetical protein